MANWVKGKLKIRGKPEDIKRWVEECLHCYFTKWFRDGSYEDELVDDAVVFEHDPKAREMRLDTIEDAYIEGTKRNFVEKGVYGDSYREDEKPILVVSMKAAWNVDETPYIEMSKKYNVDFRVYGYEMGLEFNREIENDSRKPNDNQPKRSLLRRLAAFLNDMVAEIIDALEL